MSDKPEDPFGLSLLKKRLRPPGELPGRAPGEHLQLREPRLDLRGIRGGRPNESARGLGQYPAQKLSINGAPTRSGQAESKPLSDVSTFIRELSSLQVEGMFKLERPGNVGRADLVRKDAGFTGSSAPIAGVIMSTARRFGLRPGLLAEHLAAEIDDWDDISKLPANAKLKDHLRVKPVTTSASGLDDFVNDRKLIEQLVPAAKTIGRGSFSEPMLAESDATEAFLKDWTPEEIERRKKPQRQFPLGDAIAASAAYVRYKQERARKHIPDFDSLPQEIQFQLTRLFVNPPSKNKRVGINYIIREANAGNYMNLYNFSDLTEEQSSDPHKARDVYRRATIHTARAFHLERDILPTE